jgi:hypothetical protein
MYQGMLWFDSDDNMLKQRDTTNAFWIERPGVSLAETITGLWTFSRGAAIPFACAAGSLMVANLDADKVDGVEGINLGNHYSGAVVYSGAGVGAYTNLDLSAIVGANRAVVTLKVKNTAVGTGAFSIRPDGDVDTYTNISLLTLNSIIVTAFTSAAGIIEWNSSVAVDITLLAYSRAA